MARNRRQPQPVTPVNKQEIITPPPAVLGGNDLTKNEALAPDLQVGVTGLAQFSGLIYQEPLQELRGRDAYKRYNEMRLNSPIIGALLLSVENPLRSTSWTFSSTTEDDPRLDLLNASRDNMEESWNDFISEAMTMLPFGFSLFEICYEMVDGKMLWKSFSPRGQDTVLRWLFEEVRNGEDDNNPKQRLVGFVQLAPPHYRLTPIPIEKCINFRLHTERDNPEGRSILRTSWVPYYYIKHLQQIEAIGIERDLAGLPVITLPLGASTGGANTDDAKAATIGRNIRNDEQAAIVIPNGWDVKLLSAAGSKQFDTDKTINRYEKRILTSALAQFLMLGQDGIGALALSKDQTDFFTMSVNAIGDIIAETFTQVAIPKLMELNGMSADGLRLEHTPAQGGMGVTIVADFLQKVGPYITWTAEDEVWLRQIATLPEKDADQLTEMMNEKQVQKDAENAATMARLKLAYEPRPGDPTGKPQGIYAEYYLSEQDVKARAKREREFTKAIETYLEASKKRVLKAAKELR